MKFEEINLNDNTLDALYDMHFEEMTPVQEHSIPQILNGRDVLGVAQTGTGKTAAYLLPILSRLDDGGFPDDAINCVIMSPTRELAQQIDQAMQGFAYYMPSVSSVAVYGGNDGSRYEQEHKAMQMGADVIIATPGRLKSHITMGNTELSRVSFFVLDEADRMLDMGFSDDILSIAKLLPSTCQTIMFSATMPPKIEQLANTLMHNPAIVKIAVSLPAEKIHQMAYVCHETQKLRILSHLFHREHLSRVIIFTSSKLKTKEINRALRSMNVNSGEMHSDLSQAERDDVMYRFKTGQIDILVATDIVARGIDIDDISVVINYDVPHDAEDYVHRIGRTARAERDGQAITLIRGWDIVYFIQIEKFLGYGVEKLTLPNGMKGPEYKAMTKRGGRGVFHGRDKKGKPRYQNEHRKSRNKASAMPHAKQVSAHHSACEESANGNNHPKKHSHRNGKQKKQ